MILSITLHVQIDQVELVNVLSEVRLVYICNSFSFEATEMALS